jgi:aspartate ammonia-lyase
MSTEAKPESSPPTVLYGEQTRLALKNFPSRGRKLADLPEMVRAYALVKTAASAANVELGTLDAARGQAVIAAAREVADGIHARQFPTALVQGGGGTSTNMNVNEVVAARATELLVRGGNEVAVHPNDHVNRSQSTNDTYPTAMALTVLELSRPALAGMAALHDALEGKAAAYATVQHLGRTCLQDAVPLSVGQTHRAQADAVARCRAGLQQALRPLHAVPLGATIVGTGLGAPAGYAEAAVRHLAGLSGYDLSVAPNFFDALAHLDPYAGVGDACARAATVLAKIASDLRFLSSGPTGGIGEVTLPALQAGSSIMPGKVNPVLPELVLQLSHRIRGAAETVRLAAAAGELELNVMGPVVLDALATALADIADAGTYFAEKCIAGLAWNHRSVAARLSGSRRQLVEQAASEGYDAAVRAAAELT